MFSTVNSRNDSVMLQCQNNGPGQTLMQHREWHPLQPSLHSVKPQLVLLEMHCFSPQHTADGKVSGWGRTRNPHGPLLMTQEQPGKPQTAQVTVCSAVRHSPSILSSPPFFLPLFVCARACVCVWMCLHVCMHVCM